MCVCLCLYALGKINIIVKLQTEIQKEMKINGCNVALAGSSVP